MPVRRFAPIFKRSVGMLVLASYAADGQLGEERSCAGKVALSSETACLKSRYDRRMYQLIHMVSDSS